MSDTARADREDEALQRLYELAGRVYQLMDAGLAERCLTGARARVLWWLRREGPATSRALSRRLEVTPRNVTGLVDGLVDSGLVRRVAHPSDGRAALVELTSEGWHVTEQLRREHRDHAHVLFAFASGEDIDVFVAIAERLIADLHPFTAATGTE